ncbi:hypothetical protein BD413DRAFT_182981 [Trametes elegans]|nr:hypothetical protein BD413DRAFT_182981 [Trametes elegans]
MCVQDAIGIFILPGLQQAQHRRRRCRREDQISRPGVEGHCHKLGDLGARRPSGSNTSTVRKPGRVQAGVTSLCALAWLGGACASPRTYGHRGISEEPSVERPRVIAKGGRSGFWRKGPEEGTVDGVTSWLWRLDIYGKTATQLSSRPPLHAVCSMRSGIGHERNMAATPPAVCPPAGGREARAGASDPPATLSSGVTNRTATEGNGRCSIGDRTGGTAASVSALRIAAVGSVTCGRSPRRRARNERVANAGWPG